MSDQVRKTARRSAHCLAAPAALRSLRGTRCPRRLKQAAPRRWPAPLLQAVRSLCQAWAQLPVLPLASAQASSQSSIILGWPPLRGSHFPHGWPPHSPAGLPPPSPASRAWSHLLQVRCPPLLTAQNRSTLPAVAQQPCQGTSLSLAPSSQALHRSCCVWGNLSSTIQAPHRSWRHCSSLHGHFGPLPQPLVSHWSHA